MLPELLANLGRRAVAQAPRTWEQTKPSSSTPCSPLSIPCWPRAGQRLNIRHQVATWLGFCLRPSAPETDFGAEICGQEVPWEVLLGITPGDFPGGPGAKTLCCQCRGAGVRSLVGKLSSHIPQLRVIMLQLKKIVCAATKTQCRQVK